MAAVCLTSASSTASIKDISFAAESHSALNTHKYLSPFQVVKFSYMFDAFFDIEKNGLLEEDDLDAFFNKIIKYLGVEPNSKRYFRFQDVKNSFWECIKDQLVREYKADDDGDAMIGWDEAFAKAREVDTSKMTLTQWLNMWGRLCYRSAGISDFPIWVQLLPSVFFDVMDKSCDGTVHESDLRAFYEHFVGVSSDEIDKVTANGYAQMTANGDYKLCREHYFFCFANFLLGRDIYGPGKYIFGVFDNREIDHTYMVKYNEYDSE